MLQRGELFGTVRARMDFPDATIIETRYEAGTRLPMHGHELPNLLLVLRGGFDEVIGRKKRSCAERELYFRAPGEEHSQRFDRGAVTCLTVELPRESSLSNLRSDDSFAGVPALHALRLYDEVCQPTRETPLIVEELLIGFYESARRRGLTRERRAPAWLGVVREAIHARLDQSIRVADLARLAGVHRVHLSRTFAQFYGCSIAEYVRRQRVHVACARLRTGGETGSTIAAMSGFSDESHMGRTFRGVLSCTPDSYRRRGQSRARELLKI